MSKETVIILCGGKGLRLRPITKNIPKPLIEINKKPILEHIINHFIKYKFNDFIIATGYKSDKIEEFMVRKFNNINYKIINSGDVEIIKRIIDCTRDLQTNSILCYGDTLTNINLDSLKEFHNDSKNLLTISGYKIKIPFGVMHRNSNNFVIKFEEKPTLNEVMNIGFFYISKNLYSIFNKHKSFEDMLIKLSHDKLLKCYIHNGIHITINTIAELYHANENIKKLYS